MSTGQEAAVRAEINWAAISSNGDGSNGHDTSINWAALARPTPAPRDLTTEEPYATLLAELASGERWGPAWRAITLAVTPEAAAALLRGETIPMDQFDHRALARYGWKRTD